MSTSPATTPAAIVRSIFEDLLTFAEQKGGVAAIARNPQNLVELLAEPPVAWRIILHWAGDVNADPDVRGGAVVDNKLYFILDGDLGMGADPSQDLVKDEGDTAFLTILSAVRSRALSYRFPALGPQNNRLRYAGADDNVTLPEGYHLAAYNLQFHLFTVMEATSDIITLTPPAPAA